MNYSLSKLVWVAIKLPISFALLFYILTHLYLFAYSVISFLTFIFILFIFLIHFLINLFSTSNHQFDELVLIFNFFIH